MPRLAESGISPVNLLAPTAEAAARSLAIALLALALARPLARLLAHTQGRMRTVTWALLLAPLLTPALLVSYAYSHLALRLMAVPGGGTALYLVALALKFTPVAVLVLHFAPPALAEEGAHCHALLGRSWCQGWMFRIRGAGRTPWIAGGLVLLIAFTDFELASLWSVKTWTVALFDAQTGGLALSESLRLAALPLGIEVAALALLLRRADAAPSVPAGWKTPGPAARLASFIYLAVAALAACALPLLIVAAQAASGIPAIAQNFVLGGDLATSVALAIGASVCAWPLAGWIARRRGIALGLCVPGLLGALLISLFVLTAFQLPLLRAAYDTPIPLLLALTLLLVPLAVPLCWLLDTARRDPALHLAHMAGAREVIWRLDTRRRWLAAFLLFYWAYFDFTAGSILAPIGLTPVFARLHNLAHYGQTAVLSAMMLAAFAVPVLVLALAAAVARVVAGRR